VVGLTESIMTLGMRSRLDSFAATAIVARASVSKDPEGAVSRGETCFSA